VGARRRRRRHRRHHRVRSERPRRRGLRQPARAGQRPHRRWRLRGGRVDQSVSDLFAPFSGEVTETNADVEADPSLVNASPFERGWLFRARIEAAEGLLDPAAYAALTDNA
jgi:hypothetical protein